MYADNRIQRRSELENATQGAIEGSMRFANWPGILKTEYLNQTEDRDRQMIVFQQAVGIAITLLSCAIDLWSIPEEAARGFLLRIILVIPVGVALIAFAQKLSLLHLKIGTTFTLSAFGAIVMHLASFADPETATRYTMATTVLLCMSVMILPYHTMERALFAIVFTVSTLTAGIWPHPISTPIIVEHGLLMVLVGGAAVFLAVRTVDLMDRNFLLSLRDDLSRSALEQTNLVLKELAQKDALTGLPNRRMLHSVFETEFRMPKPEQAAQSAQEIQTSVMMIDLDYFKQFNDEHGHQAGDRALKVVSQYLDEAFNDIDGVVARFGGEEFVAIFRCMSVREAEAIANKVRLEISSLPVPVRHKEITHVTTSIGVASIGANSDYQLSDLTARADRALYAAKAKGRNRVVVSEHIELRVERRLANP